MELGCGNSQLSEELYKDGITKITCIDLSAVAVENKKKQLLSKGFKGVVKYLCMYTLFAYFLMFSYRLDFQVLNENK